MSLIECRMRLATVEELGQVAMLDHTATGSTTRKQLIQGAIEQEQCYVVMLGREMVAYGILHYHFFGNGFIELLVVQEHRRRQGIGKFMLKELKGICRTEKLFTSTNSSNLPMQRLLESCGFWRCGWVDQLDPGDPELFYCHHRL
ncbi:MAG: GNAT family N-acetyltransferase [Bacillota bacterium]|jgi:GNAT superfamily N-acetyltransferase